jgi:hypothetical protein
LLSAVGTDRSTAKYNEYSTKARLGKRLMISRDETEGEVLFGYLKLSGYQMR